jgi:hypothetical protein
MSSTETKRAPRMELFPAPMPRLVVITPASYAPVRFLVCLPRAERAE